MASISPQTEKASFMTLLKKLQSYWGVFAGNSQSVFRFALFSGIILSLLAVLFIYDMYRDVANVYAYYAREISMGNWQEGWVGRVPMMHILLSGLLSKFSGIEAYKSTVIISSMFFVLTLFPLRRFLERYVSQVWSSWGCVLFIFAPSVIRNSVCGLLESARYFFLIAALLFCFRLSDGKFKWYEAILFGICLAGLSVSRGEGLLIAFIILAALPFLILIKQHFCFQWKKLKSPLAGFAVATVFFLVGFLPFCYGNWKFYGVFAPDMRIGGCIALVLKKLTPEAAKVQSCGLNGDEVKLKKFAPAATNDTEASKELARTSGRSDKASLIFKNLSKTFRGAYVPYLLFALLGVALLLRLRKWNWEFSLLWVLFFVHFLVYAMIVSAHRYSIYLVPLFMPFTLNGVAFVLQKGKEWLEHRGPGVVHTASCLTGACVIVLLICQGSNGMKCVTDRKDKQFREVAAFIRNYSSEHFPGRRCKIAAGGHCTIVVYWSGAIAHWGYKQTEKKSDFDLLLLLKRKAEKVPAEYGKLEEVPAPSDFPVKIFRKAEQKK